MMHRIIFKWLVIGLLLTSSQCEENNQAVRKVMDIPSAAKETSGIGIYGSYFFTHNDSGDGPYIYVLDTMNRNISHKVKLNGARNVDWEDMDVDGGKLYIADTGDNTSNRFKNSVYVVNIDSLITSGVSLNKYDEIQFTFRSKKDKKRKVNSEAMMVIRDTIYFLSKDYKETDVYMLPPGSDEAVKIGDLKLPFEATACCQMSEGTFAISGYEKLTDTYYISDVAILTVEDLPSWKGIEWKTMDLRLKAQVEGIDYAGSQLFISAEGIGISPGKLMAIK